MLLVWICCWCGYDDGVDMLLVWICCWYGYAVGVDMMLVWICCWRGYDDVHFLKAAIKKFLEIRRNSGNNPETMFLFLRVKLISLNLI